MIIVKVDWGLKKLLTSMESKSRIYDNTQNIPFHTLPNMFPVICLRTTVLSPFFAITIKITMDKIELQTEFK